MRKLPSKTRAIRWIQQYYGIRLSRRQIAKIAAVIELDGGMATWDREPLPPNAILLAVGSSATYVAV